MKSHIKEVFKVVKADGLKYLSAIETGRNQLEYKPNTITKPKQGKIFAFSSLEFAAQFICDEHDLLFQIWRAKGKNPEEIKEICLYPQYDGEFWRNLITNKTYLGHAPHGTVAVEELELLEQVS